MQVVEYVEERILGTGTHQILDIVYNENVYTLIEGNEIYNAVVLDGVHVLGLELVPRYIEDHLVLEMFLNGNTDGLGNVGFAQTRTSEEEQRVEGRFTGSLRDIFCGIDTQFVALPFYQVTKAVNRIEAGIDFDALHAREHEGTGAAGRLVRGNGNRIVGGNGALAGGKDHPFLVLDRADQIEELTFCADGSLDGEPEQFLISIFDILTEEIRRHLYGEFGSFQGYRPDEFEPGIELLRINVVFNDLQTVIPYRNMSFLVVHQG